MTKWGHVVTEYKLPGISNHYPLEITLQEAQRNGKVGFKFFNVWTEHENFLQIVEDHWKKKCKYDHMEKVWYKLKGLQTHLRKLNKSSNT